MIDITRLKDIREDNDLSEKKSNKYNKKYI